MSFCIKCGSVVVVVVVVVMDNSVVFCNYVISHLK